MMNNQINRQVKPGVKKAALVDTTNLRNVRPLSRWESLMKHLGMLRNGSCFEHRRVARSSEQCQHTMMKVESRNNRSQFFVCQKCQKSAPMTDIRIATFFESGNPIDAKPPLAVQREAFNRDLIIFAATCTALFLSTIFQSAADCSTARFGAMNQAMQLEYFSKCWFAHLLLYYKIGMEIIASLSHLNFAPDGLLTSTLQLSAVTLIFIALTASPTAIIAKVLKNQLRKPWHYFELISALLCALTFFPLPLVSFAHKRIIESP